MTDNPNAKDENGKTPIYWAALNGHTEIVKILAPLTDNPNVPNKNGITPINVAKNAKSCRLIESFIKESRKRKQAPSLKPSEKRAKKL